MKLTVQRDALWRGIDTIIDVVPNKPAMPVLANVLIVAGEDELTLSATDLDLSIRTRIGASVSQSGTVTVPARTFAEIAREWPGDELSLETREERVIISGKPNSTEGSEGAYSLTGIAPDEFPGMPTSPSGITLDFGVEGLDTHLLSAMISKTGFAVSRDETRPVLNGILWHFDHGGLDMVATDGSRLAKYRRSVDLSEQMGQRESADVILPPQVCAHLVKLLGGERPTAVVTVGESQIFFNLGDTQLLSRLIEGPYVDYSQVIPKLNEKQLKVATEEFLPAVRRVSILASSYTHQVRLALTADKIELSAASQEVGGDARESVAAAYENEDLDIGYNANFLIEMLRKMDGGEVLLELQNSVTATLVRPCEMEEGEEYFCLLMPLRPSG